jgi:predicted metal-dependent hydrolase
MNITIKKQRRKSIALQYTTKGIRILIPQDMDEDDPFVKDFIERNAQSVPNQPPRIQHTWRKSDLNALAEEWALKLDVPVSRVIVRPLITKWGSISTAGVLTLSDDLLTIPKPLVEYVIVHELMHLKFPNHGKAWKASMGIYLPDWKERDALLQTYALLEPVISSDEV